MNLGRQLLRSQIYLRLARLLIVTFFVLVLIVGAPLTLAQNREVDEGLLKTVKQGWQEAISNSRKVTQVQALVRRTNPRWPNVTGTEVHAFALKGSKRFYASSHNGHADDLKAQVSVLRVFDGTNDAIAQSSELFKTSPSDKEQWAIASLEETGKVNPLVERMFAFVQTAGIKIADSVDLSYFDLDAPHVDVLELYLTSKSDRELVFCKVGIDRQKYAGIQVSGIREARMYLDPRIDYLPIEVTTTWMRNERLTDIFEYEPFGSSYYLKNHWGKATSETSAGESASATYEMEIHLFSTEVPADSVFRLATYGLTEPKRLAPTDNGFRSWHLVLAGVAMIAIGVVVRHYNSRRNQ